MTASEWETSDNPVVLYDYLTYKTEMSNGIVKRHAYARLSKRKSRLLAVACCRGVCPDVCHDDIDYQGQLIIDVAERFADGLVIEAVRGRMARLISRSPPAGTTDIALEVINILWATIIAVPMVHEVILSSLALGLLPQTVATWIRDVAGNPLAPVVLPTTEPDCHNCNGYGTLEPLVCADCHGTGKQNATCPWLTWNDGTVPKLAETIYTKRAYHLCPILADALEDAGCHISSILRHLRDTSISHVRGCWAIDLLTCRT